MQLSPNKNTGKTLAIVLSPWYTSSRKRRCRRTVASLTCRLLRQDLEVRDGVIFLSKKLPTLVAVVKRNYESNDGTKYQDEAEQLLISNIHAHHLPSGRGKQPSAVGGSAPAQSAESIVAFGREKCNDKIIALLFRESDTSCVEFFEDPKIIPSGNLTQLVSNFFGSLQKIKERSGERSFFYKSRPPLDKQKSVRYI